MLMRRCPKCYKLITADKQYCDDCKLLVDEQREIRNAERRKKYNKNYDKARNKEYVQFYNSKEWRALRAVKLSSTDYMCEQCKKNGIVTLAKEVHHIEPLSSAWDKRLDIDNLMCLCTVCHNREHDRYMRGYRKPYKAS